MIEEQHATALIEVDGGVNSKNAKALFEAGADVLVAGNAVFKSENPMEVIKELKFSKYTWSSEKKGFSLQ